MKSLVSRNKSLSKQKLYIYLFFVQFFQVHSNNNLPSNLPVLEQQLNLLQQVDFLVLPHLLSVQLQHLQQVPLVSLNSKPQVLLANLNSKPDPLVCSAQIIKPSLLVRNLLFFLCYIFYLQCRPSMRF